MAAQGLYGGAAAEAVGNGGGTGGSQDGCQVVRKHIAQGNGAVTVQAAGNHSAVAEDAEVIPKAVAGHMGAVVGGGGVRPGEAVAPLQKQTVPDAVATGVGLPLTGQQRLQQRQGSGVAAIIAAVVPKPQR